MSNSKTYKFFPQTNIPGYAGYIPRRIYDCGSTFGKTAASQQRQNVVNNQKDKYYRTGPAFLGDTLAATKLPPPKTASGHASEPCRDGHLQIPRYNQTFEKPGYAGHVPMHVEDVMKSTSQSMEKPFARNMPGYCGHLPGAGARVGETWGRLAARDNVSTPRMIAGSRMLFSAHGSFRAPPPNAYATQIRTPTPCVTPPWATD